MRIDAERQHERRRDTPANRAHVKSFLRAVSGDADRDTMPAPRNARRNRPYIFGQE